MGRAFTEIAFTDSVRAAQSRYGSRRQAQALERSSHRADAFSDQEREFIASRDSFYQATVSETGWPYVQFRGGPPGFLKVVDAKTLAYADYRGNAQYLSIGNIGGDGRIALILMDYPDRRRLKIWGTARIADATQEPTLFSALTFAPATTRTERAVVISVEAFDWNCPQYITPRFTEDEVRAATAPLLAELEALRTREGLT